MGRIQHLAFGSNLLSMRLQARRQVERRLTTR